MELTFLNEFYMPIVLAACLIVGYCIKHIEWISKRVREYIPTILAILGAILACISKGDITLQLIVAGAFTGLTSTGLHQAFKQIISRKNSAKCDQKEGGI
ncbi:MAG: holin [Clostridia bacterium]|nr:holin [Clostridia bacterium]NCC43373.1 holin [Clostridia bacterium]